MLVGQHFELDEGDRRSEEPVSPTPAPLVVIQYRNRGIPLVLLLPILLLAVIVGSLAHQRGIWPRDDATPRPVHLADGGQPPKKKAVLRVEAPKPEMARSEAPA